MLPMQNFIVRTHSFTFLCILWQVEEMHSFNFHLLTLMHTYYHFFTLSGAVLNIEDKCASILHLMQKGTRLLY